MCVILKKRRTTPAAAFPKKEKRLQPRTPSSPRSPDSSKTSGPTSKTSPPSPSRSRSVRQRVLRGEDLRGVGAIVVVSNFSLLFLGAGHMCRTHLAHMWHTWHGERKKKEESGPWNGSPVYKCRKKGKEDGKRHALLGGKGGRWKGRKVFGEVYVAQRRAVNSTSKVLVWAASVSCFCMFLVRFKPFNLKMAESLCFYVTEA